MISYLNLGSLVLGIIAWVLPVINILSYKNNDNKNWVILSVISLSACAISLCFQMIYNYHLVQIEDWSALLDTTGGVVFVSVVLLIVTITLNTINLMLYRNRIIK